MIVECSRRPDGWIPVKGNEEEIIDFLWGQNYYTKYSVKETKNSFDFWVATEFVARNILIIERVTSLN